MLRMSTWGFDVIGFNHAELVDQFFIKDPAMHMDDSFLIINIHQNFPVNPISALMTKGPFPLYLGTSTKTKWMLLPEEREYILSQSRSHT